MVYFNNIEENIERIFLEKKYSAYVLISDSTVAPLWLNTIQKLIEKAVEVKPISCIIPAGENHKNLSSCIPIWEVLTEKNIDRNAVVINLGGGIVSDLGGFIAASYKRGIDSINIPTTLLAMVDATVGGKVGIDFNHFKNQLGFFYEPKHILIDTLFLKTLPKREFINGWAEVLKHSLLQDTASWNVLKIIDIYNLVEEDLLKIIQENIEFKQQIVLEDFKEQGIRKTLNLGHTIGHALESLSIQKDEMPLLHGECVAIGLIGALYLSVKKHSFPTQDFEEITQYILRFFPKRYISDTEKEMLFDLLKQDKKNSADQVQFVLLESLGKSIWNCAVSKNEIEETIDFLNSL